MMRLSVFTLMAAFAAITPCLAQDPPVVWNEVTPTEILMKSYAPDTSAAAVVLADYGQIYVSEGDKGYEYRLTRLRRVKIFNQTGFDYADISIPFYRAESTENVQRIRAQAITTSGKRIELSNKDFYTEKINDYWSAVHFSFPNLQEGSIIEYSYDLYSKDLVKLRTWFFQESIPVVKSELRVYNNTYLEYVLMFEGGEYMDKKELPNKVVLLEKGDQKFRLELNRYIMENAPALKEEAYITNMDDYRAKIRFQLSKITYRSGAQETVLTTWKEAAKEMVTHNSFGNLYLRAKHSDKAFKTIKPLVKDDLPPEEKAKIVYNYLSTHLKWNKDADMFPDHTPDETLELGSGSTSELNLLCLAVLRQLNLEAFPVLTSTRSHGRLNTQYPIMDQFDYVMVALMLDGGKIQLLDISDPMRPMGLPQIDALNQFGWVVNPDNPMWINIDLAPCRDVFNAVVNITPEGHLTGALRASFNSYSALFERHALEEDPKAEYWKKRLSGVLADVVIDSLKFENQEDYYQPFVNKIFFTIPNAADQSSDLIYFSPILYSNFSENPFKLKERSYPIDFPYPFEEKYQLTLVIPDGYEVEELPENANFALPDKGGNMQFTITTLGNKVQLASNITVTRTKYTPNEYGAIKEMFDLMINKHQEPIVLKKKQ